ncbi:MAG: serine/threonine-protein kinase, partial [Fuerstiella sp.]
MISHNQLDEIVESILQEHRNGQIRDVDDYVQTYPEWAEQIREVVPAALMVEKFKAVTELGLNNSSSNGVLLSGKSIDQLGDYEIIRELGRGGMGVVYEATQQSLNRKVAVKVLKRSDVVNETGSLRFVREARIAAKLHHTNIVPILDVSQHDDVHFYVMQLIDGCSLDRIMNVLQSLSAEPQPEKTDSGCALRPSIREASIATQLLSDRAFTDEPVKSSQVKQQATPAFVSQGDHTRPLSDKEITHLRQQRLGRHTCWWQHVAEVGQQVADALVHAHGQGVLHRDIKPGNLILDDQQRVWVTDFGLATSEESMSITASGDAVGTLRYMAPEQFDAKTNTSSDTYSLGATLYELSTGHPAFTGKTKPQLIQRILAGTCKRPRQHVPAMPRDLENIILKAMAHSPEQRYQTAQQLSNDLSRFLQDRPVHARPINVVTRCWRWCRRHPAVAIPTVSAGLLLLLVAVVTTLGYFQVKQALSEKAIEYQRAEEQQALADENLKK